MNFYLYINSMKGIDLRHEASHGSLDDMCIRWPFLFQGFQTEYGGGLLSKE